MTIPFNKPFIAGKELYYIAEAVLKNLRLSGNGPFTKKCERWLEEHLAVRKALLCHSCTAALEMAAILADIQPGDEVIMPSFTFVSTANSIVLRGGVPVFVDVRPDTLNIDENLIGQAITARTRAILPVHYAGVSCAMEAIMDIAQHHDLLVIEDAAQALLSVYQNKPVGSWGNMACLSFHETKNVISGEGGALLINSEQFVERADIIREKGTNRTKFLLGEVDKYTWVDIGSSFLPGELTAAFLYAQLEQAQNIQERRCELMEAYFQLLSPLKDRGCIELPFLGSSLLNGHLFYIITRSLAERTALIEYLARRGIDAVFHYVPLHCSPAGQRFGRPSGPMEVTQDVADRLLRLPMYYEMTCDEVEIVAEALFGFYSER